LGFDELSVVGGILKKKSTAGSKMLDKELADDVGGTGGE